MIEAGFEFPIASKRRVVEALLSLPGELRPTHKSDSEDEIRTEIGDNVDIDKLLRNEYGFFLTNERIVYDICFAGDAPIRCNCFLETDYKLAEALLIHVASARPVFGFACVPSEREGRNRVVETRGVNTIESWVGRKTQDYIPGIYWLTLLSTALVERHNVPLSAIEATCVEHIEIEGGGHLFRMYEQPQDWLSSAGVGELYSTLPCLFDIDSLKPELVNATTILEISAITRKWS